MTRLHTLSSLMPDSYRIETTAKVIELLVSLKTTNESNNDNDNAKPITLYEYLIADDTGCIILNTQQQLEIDQVYTLKDGYTKVILDNLRLFSNDLQKRQDDDYKIQSVDLQNNRSFISFHRKL